MPALPSDTITLPLLPRTFARASPKKMYKARSVLNVTPIRRDDDNVHDKSISEIYKDMDEWKKILLWISVAAAAIFLLSVLLCLLQCCCRRRRVIQVPAKNHHTAPSSSDTLAVISAPIMDAQPAPRPLAADFSPSDGQMVDVSLKTPAAAAAPPRYDYGGFVSNQRNITGLAPPQKTATYGAMPSPSWNDNPSDRFGGPSTSYMS